MNKKDVLNGAWGLAQAFLVVVAVLLSAVIVGLLVVVFPASLRQQLITPSWLIVLGSLSYVIVVFLLMMPSLLTGVAVKQLLPRFFVGKKLAWEQVGKALLVWLGYMVVSSLITALLFYVQAPGFISPERQDLGFTTLSGAVQLLAVGAAFVVVAPIFEEAIFRGYLFGQLRGRLGLVVSAFLTSLAFGAVHGGTQVMVDVFFLSLALCWLRERTGSIWPGVVVHALKNGLAYTLVFVLPLFGVSLL